MNSQLSSHRADTTSTIPSLGYFAGFNPMASSPLGLAAIEKFSLPPYIDGSCRREPDFEHYNPIITALCRKEMLVPRLAVGDAVMYMNNKGKTSQTWDYHLVAVLRVVRLISSHEKAEALFKEAGIALPSNCMVEGNAPAGFDQTIGPPDKENNNFGKRFREAVTTGNKHKAASLLIGWDSEYWGIAHDEDKPKLRKVAFTHKHYVNVHTPPVVPRSLLDDIFGPRKPGLQNSAPWPMGKVNELLVALGIEPVK